jgi:hypothetical protein
MMVCHESLGFRHAVRDPIAISISISISIHSALFFLATTSTEHYVHSCRKRFRRSSSLAMPIAKTRRLHAAASHQCIPSLLRNGTEAGADLGKWRNPRSISSLQKTVKAMASVSSYVQSTRCIWLFSPFYWHPSTKNRRLIIERAGIYRNQNVTECRCTD